MNFIADYVSKLSDYEKLLIIQSFEELEQTGIVAEGPVRSYVMTLNKILDRPAHNTAIMVRDLALECYRHFANKTLKPTEHL